MESHHILIDDFFSTFEKKTINHFFDKIFKNSFSQKKSDSKLIDDFFSNFEKNNQSSFERKIFDDIKKK